MPFFSQSLAKAASLIEVVSGQEIKVKVNLILGHDGTASKLLKTWKNSEFEKAPENKVLITIDHAYPAPTIQERTLQQELFKVSNEMDLHLYSHGEGVLHQVVAEEGSLRPGMIIVGADGHVATSGAFGALAFSLSAEELVNPLETGYYKLTVPEIVTITLENQLQSNVMARDVALYILGKWGSNIKGKAVALTGSFLEQASIASKMALCNLLPEAGVVTAFVLPSQEEAEGEVYQVDVSVIEPMIAVPPSPTHVQSVKDLVGKKITVAILGGCSAGRIEDMMICAAVLKGRKIPPEVTLIITPASSKIANEMDELGLTPILRKSGAIIMPPGCGPCPGKHFGLLSPQDVAITTTIRNSPGRIGSEDAEILLASPRTVAESALKGVISCPKS
ncbi:aconitase family protein [Desulfitobacterium metallireducens]|uniref:3-isopropylmalate dehydratase n=1 Tax=Desulfitobacterium metallireducens DSM 15288 TaxID=871968 RepID=W0ECV4_9FIRM|nr:aconitase family protein [Desulfitobacterium metallireducens]AHF07034.1 3-isopropylmalate dehydratase [Desulfitobacterium metallireducens DSM 15288]